ncbi:HET-domain-containing protein [Lophium mytilinum]|uniref:HET-domain-containing protein n=1 Tax=Lophium mytilinum TaxID=390894 RepID=A0A6A6R549_9PEZI|nr:HET-domain-containing protein [Lophium mytilinum]
METSQPLISYSYDLPPPKATCRYCSLLEPIERESELCDFGHEWFRFDHHFSLSAFQQSCLTCPVCKLRLNQFVSHNGEGAAHDLSDHTSDDQQLSRQVSGKRTGYRLLDNIFGFTCPSPIYVSFDLVQYLRPSFVFSPIADTVSQRLIWKNCRAFSTAESLGVVSQWLDECESAHELCRPNSFCVPTRLIDVGPSNGSTEPRLLEPNKPCSMESFNYTALSHCWGRAGQPSRTTLSTFSGHLDCIPMSSLTKTYQDAVSITRGLKIRFLWIDSLCIIQDDEKDWQHESSLMESIYANSFLTIAATASADGSGGCFQTVRPSIPVEVKSSIFGQDDSNRQTHQVYLRPQTTHEDLISKSPLFRRAWTLQETVLSRRTVHFTHNQLYWQCRTLSASEDGSIYRGSEHTLPVSTFGAAPGEIWKNWVEDYSNRELSNRADKLAALAGLTKLYAKETGEIPLVGIWESQLHVWLSWYRSEHGDQTRSFERIAGIPSWSWASLDGPVSIFETPALSREVSDFELISTSLQWSGEPLTSTLVDARLVLRAKLLQAEIEGTGILYLQGTGDNYLGWIVYLDSPSCQVPRKISCLLLSTRGGPATFLLVLSVEPDCNVFRRVGLAILHPVDEFISIELQNATMEVVTLI